MVFKSKKGRKKARFERIKLEKRGEFRPNLSAKKLYGRTRKEMDESRPNRKNLRPYITFKVKQAKKCFICKKPFKNYKEKECHHLIPRSLGGNDTLKNVVCVHKEECHEEADRMAFEKYGNREEKGKIKNEVNEIKRLKKIHCQANKYKRLPFKSITQYHRWEDNYRKVKLAYFECRIYKKFKVSVIFSSRRNGGIQCY